jgi:uncharacterized protein YigA (DUF484 family)
MDYLRDRIDKAKIEELENDLEVERLRTKELEKRIDDLKKKKSANRKINKDLRKKVEKMPDSQKKKLLLEYVDRLLEKRK